MSCCETEFNPKMFADWLFWSKTELNGVFQLVAFFDFRHIIPRVLSVPPKAMTV